MNKKQKYIYVIGHDTAFKIGFSSNPDARIKQLQTANDKPLKLLWSMARNDAVQLEKHLHRMFSRYRKHGEWFLKEEISIDQIKAQAYGYTEYDW